MFQACVSNYIAKMLKFHQEDIFQNRIAQNFLTLSVRIDRLNQEEIRSLSILQKWQNVYSSEQAKILKVRYLLSNCDYAIPVETQFYIYQAKKRC